MFVRIERLKRCKFTRIFHLESLGQLLVTTSALRPTRKLADIFAVEAQRSLTAVAWRMEN